MDNEITLAYVQEMIRRREGRLGEKQQILRLVEAVGRLAHAVEQEENMEEAFGDILYNTLALANTYGIDMEKCIPVSVPISQQGKKQARDLDFRPL